jgi:hypothetical protein
VRVSAAEPCVRVGAAGPCLWVLLDGACGRCWRCLGGAADAVRVVWVLLNRACGCCWSCKCLCECDAAPGACVVCLLLLLLSVWALLDGACGSSRACGCGWSCWYGWCCHCTIGVSAAAVAVVGVFLCCVLAAAVGV